MRLEIKDLDVAYGRTQVVFGVSLDVPSGSLTCLMGRNGVGKTTLLNTVMGLLPARSGSILLDGEDITKAITYKRARMGIGYVPQGHQVFPGLTVRENLNVVHERTRGGDIDADQRRRRPVPGAGDDDGPPGRAAVGRSGPAAGDRQGARDPAALLVLDEPTEGIQPSIIMQIEDAIAQLHASGDLTILLVEQYVEFALRLAERYAVMDAGRIEHSGDVATADAAMFASLVSI